MNVIWRLSYPLMLLTASQLPSTDSAPALLPSPASIFQPPGSAGALPHPSLLGPFSAHSRGTLQHGPVPQGSPWEPCWRSPSLTLVVPGVVGQELKRGQGQGVTPSAQDHPWIAGRGR